MIFLFPSRSEKFSTTVPLNKWPKTLHQLLHQLLLLPHIFLVWVCWIKPRALGSLGHSFFFSSYVSITLSVLSQISEIHFLHRHLLWCVFVWSTESFIFKIWLLYCISISLLSLSSMFFIFLSKLMMNYIIYFGNPCLEPELTSLLGFSAYLSHLCEHWSI